MIVRIVRQGIWFLALSMLVFPVAALASEASLRGEEIRETLNGNTVVGVKDGQKWRQTFNSNGNTVYHAGSAQPSAGRWRVDGDRYCSTWPPQSRWTCYDMTGSLNTTPKTVTFIGGGGDLWPAEVVEGTQ